MPGSTFGKKTTKAKALAQLPSFLKRKANITAMGVSLFRSKGISNVICCLCRKSISRIEGVHMVSFSLRCHLKKL